jgi:Sulfotransferase domain
MAACIMKNIRQNRTNNIFEGCGNDEIDIFSEINGPRRKKYHPMTGRVGFLQDDGTVDFDGPGNRIFLPQHFRMDQVHSAYPNATWILNWRDVDSWIGSVMKWGDDLHNQFFNEYFMQGAIDEIPSDKNITAVNHLLRRIYQEHYDMVREFVRLHPSHTLIEVNITAADAGNVLGQAFGLDPRAWANINKNKKGAFGSWRSQRYYGRIDFDGSPLWWLLFLGTTMYLGWFLGVEWSF